MSRIRLRHPYSEYVKMPLYTERAMKKVILPMEQARYAGSFMSHVGDFLRTGNYALLIKFEGHGVTDRAGRFHPFELRPNVLYRLDDMQTETFEDIYEIVV
jgi:hypothetical protein